MSEVVITRKLKRMNVGAHLVACVLTGGVSLIFTLWRAFAIASYNAETRRLQAAAAQRTRM